MVDATALKRSWQAVAHYGDQVPLFFYSTLFLTHPETREMFPVSMAAQRDRLVTALGKVVSNVDDLDTLVPILGQLGLDHRKFGVTRDHYPAVGSALLRTLEHFSGNQWNDDLARDWAAAYELVARTMIEAAEAAGDQPPWWEAQVVDVERRTIDVVVLRVVPDQLLTYRAGQSVAVETPLRPRLWRYYTPATLPDGQGGFELHVRLVGGGPVSTALVQSVGKGDVLRLGAPVGDHLTVPPGVGNDLVLVAGGTGLAPMKAIVEQIAAEGGNRHVHLFWGVQFHRDLYDLPALRRLTERCDWLTLVPCLSHERVVGGDAESGTAVDVALRRGPWPYHEIYACGSPPMVRGTLDALEGAGVPPGQVRVERFGNEETVA